MKRDSGPKQPSVIFNRKLREFVADSKFLTSKQLAKKWGMSEQTVSRYMYHIRNKTLIYVQNERLEKYSAEELSERHAGRKICMPWGVVSPPVPHSFIEHR